MRLNLASLFFCFLLLLVMPSTALAQQKPKKSASQLRKDLRKVQNKKAALKSEIRKTKGEAKAVKVDIQKVDAELDQVETALEETTTNLAVARDQATKTQRRLAAAEVKLKATKKQVENRLRNLYIQGDANALTALVGTTSVGDIATRKFLFERIAERDREVFERFKQLKKEVAEQKVKADSLVRRVEMLKGRQQRQQVQLNVTRDKKARYLGVLQEKVEDLQEALREFEQDEASIAAQIRAYEAAMKRGGKAPIKFGGRLSRPISAGMTSGFGMRFHPILHRTRLHAGVDFGAPVGTPIRAAGDGIVVSAATMRGYGRVVIIQHGSGLSTVYAHCSRTYVSAGQTVKAGQVIAAVGNTGLSTGPHLHFEVRINGRPVNPVGRF